MASNSEVLLCECPICCKKYPQSEIEIHVDRCLSASNEDDVGGVESRNESPRTMKRKRVDIASWCGGSHKSGVSATKDSDHNMSAQDCRASMVDVNKPLPNSSKTKTSQIRTPLAEQLRPEDLADFVGQQHILKCDSILRTLIENHKIQSMIFWGPPGCGKTSLAHVIAVQSRRVQDTKFVTLSATTAGVADVKEVIKSAKNDWVMFKRKTVLFIDEIHRFNKLQQDTFLPVVEDGTITLIGATTENPSFSLNSALLSRCRVFVLEKLTVENVKSILERAMKRLNIAYATSSPPENEHHNVSRDDCNQMTIEEDAVSVLAHLSDGDARIAINCLQLTIEAHKSKLAAGNKSLSSITVEHIKESLQRTHLLYDRKGEEHYNCISALHKSMRGNDGDASLYWLGRMLEGGEDPLYVARRLIRFASEDIGLADALALNQAVATYQACQFIGMPECSVNLAQCVVYLAEAPKSTRIYKAYCKVSQCIRSHKGPLPGVPLHLRNAPTKLMKDLGYGKDYKYNPAYQEPVEQDYLPEGLKGVTFLEDPE